MSGTVTSFSVGRDYQVVCVAPNGTRLDLNGVISFEHDAEYHEVSRTPISSPRAVRFLPNGHKFVFTIERDAPGNEGLFDQIEKGWWGAGSSDPGTGVGGSVLVYTTELNGTVTRKQGTNVSLKMVKRASVKQESAVQQVIEGFAATWGNV